MKSHGEPMAVGREMSGDGRLPPNSMEAERGVLGCVLLNPVLALPQVIEALRGEQPFYDLRNATIYAAMTGLHGEGKPVDVITLHERLRDTGNLDGIGGMSVLSELPDIVPSEAHLPMYVDIILEKHALRKLVRVCVESVATAYTFTGSFDALMAEMETKVLAAKEITRRADKKPELLKKPAEFGQEVFNMFFGIAGEEDPGLDLPIDFKFKIRPGELTLVSGDDGCGKSTFLGYALVWLMNQGQKVVVASLEEKPEKVLWGMCSQLLGTSRFNECRANEDKVQAALAWVNARCEIFDYQGIADWREILAAFRYAASQGRTVFLLDNVMRIGIADDDMGTQGLAAALFGAFAMKANAHLFAVLHENKSGDGKNKIRGSKLWTANASNIVQIEKNVKKLDKIATEEANIIGERNGKNPDLESIADSEAHIAKLKQEWDTKLILRKQREKRTRQNASRYVYYDPECFQFRIHAGDPPVNWLERWRKGKEPK